MPHETDPNKTSLFRCCEDQGRNVKYTYIRSVDNAELCGLENIDELNVVRNLTSE